jgi:hypothetical protein
LASLESPRGEHDKTEPLHDQVLAALGKMPRADYASIVEPLETSIAQLRSLGRAGEAERLDVRAQVLRAKFRPPPPAGLE